MTRLEQQMQFILEVDKLKNITRQTYIADGSRKEDDAEHSWHLALMCILLSEYANEKIDVLKTVAMVLIHDIVEIDAGDTYAYDELGNQSKRERETAAADRIFDLLPYDQAAYVKELWEEFESGETPEAKFANTLDKCQPALLNDKSGGRSWREHEVKESQIKNRNADTFKGSDKLWNYVRNIIEKNTRNGNIKADGYEDEIHRII